MLRQVYGTLKGWAPYLIFGAVFFSSFWTYAYRYQYPPYLFWDENYHIASAQKYLHGVFFMEPHPPLGKLLMALGERLLAPNSATDQFLGTMYIQGKDLPQGFSFAGYRLMPAFMGWLAAVLFYGVFRLITGSAVTAGLISTLYIFDNALIVHSRGAMLESPQIFFCAFFFLIYFYAWYHLPPHSGAMRWAGLWLGIVFGCVVSIKLNGMILGLLSIPFLSKMGFGRSWLHFMLMFGVGAVVVWCTVWQLHFHLGRKVESSLDDRGYFHISAAYREILEGKRARSMRDFPVMLADAMSFFKRYQRGVPKLNLCKPDENGSPSFFWPLGARSINYRWERAGKEGHRYLYLQANPIVWGVGLAAVLMASAFLLASCFFSGVVLKQRSQMTAFVMLYFVYLAIMASAERVLYLYHYFLPLVFSFILLALLSGEIERIGIWRVTQNGKHLALTIMAGCVFSTFLYFAPLTYYQPIAPQAVMSRAWASLWDLRCVGCPRTSMIAKPVSAKSGKKVFALGDLVISGLSPFSGSQQWGEPQYGRSVTGEPVVVEGRRYLEVLGVHAVSHLNYKLEGRFRRLHARVALPDYLEGKGSVIFEVSGDDKLLWRSGVLRSARSPEEVNISVEGVQVLELRVMDGGDGINYDHAVWLNPRLE